MAIISSVTTQTAWEMASEMVRESLLRKSSHFHHSTICWHTKGIHLQISISNYARHILLHSQIRTFQHEHALSPSVPFRILSTRLSFAAWHSDRLENARNLHSLEKVNSKTISIQKIPVHVCYSLLNKDLMSDRCHLQRTFTWTFALVLIQMFAQCWYAWKQTGNKRKSERGRGEEEGQRLAGCH